MDALKTLIPQRMDGEHVLTYARRLKKLGLIPSEVMDSSLYAIAKQQEREEKKARIEELKNEHACLACQGRGVTGEKDNWVVCTVCKGSRMETAQEDDLAGQEKELREKLIALDVHRLKLDPDIIHRIYWYCRYHGKFDIEKMIEIFLSRVHMAKREKGYFVVCDAESGWAYQGKIENEKKQKLGKLIDEPVPF